MQPKRFESVPDMITALEARQVDAVFFDISGVLPAASKSSGRLKVIGQFEVGGKVAGVLPKGSQNKPAFDEALSSMLNDGTVDGLLKTWYGPLFGADPSSIPNWKP
jgi:polar amino acid transport system substrate-binding protein